MKGLTVASIKNGAGCRGGWAGITPKQIMKFQNTLDKGKMRKAYHVCVLLSVMSDCLQPYATVAHQTPLPMGFSRQGSWRG